MVRVDLTGALPGVKLASATRRYVEAIRNGFNSGSAAPTTRWHLPRTLAAMAPGKHTLKRFAILDRDRVVGVCGLWIPRFAGVELTIAIFAPSSRGRGIGTFAVRTLCAIAFTELKTHRVELGVYPDNFVAIHAYGKCGFRREAVLRRYIYHDGRWRDVVWMSLLRSEWKRM